MWRRVKDIAKGVLRIVSPNASSNTASAASKVPSNIVTPEAASKLEAYVTFRNVLRELKSAEEKELHKQVVVIEEHKKQHVPLNESELSGEQLDDLARAYFEGENGRTPNFEEAYTLWLLGATKGDTACMYSKAVCLREGKGISKDSKQAFLLLSELAEKRDYTLAHYALGVMCSAGEGTMQNDQAAFSHFLAAANQGVVAACYNVANCYAAGRGVEKDEKKARVYYEAGALVGDISSKFVSSVWLNIGKGGPADKSRAFTLCLEAAAAGHLGAMFNAGVYYLSGEGVTADASKAAQWFERSADGGVVQGALNLSKMYAEGVGVPKDLHRAEEVLRRFAASNDEARAIHSHLVQAIANEK